MFSVKYERNSYILLERNIVIAGAICGHGDDSAEI